MGSTWDVIYRGYATALLQKNIAAVKPDVQTFGNHELWVPQPAAHSMPRSLHVAVSWFREYALINVCP